MDESDERRKVGLTECIDGPSRHLSQMPGKQKKSREERKKDRSKDVVTREYTINLHKRVHRM